MHNKTAILSPRRENIFSSSFVQDLNHNLLARVQPLTDVWIHVLCTEQKVTITDCYAQQDDHSGLSELHIIFLF